MIVGQPGCWGKFKEDWVMKWAPAILKVANIDEIKVSDDDELEGLDEPPPGD